MAAPRIAARRLAPRMAKSSRFARRMSVRTGPPAGCQRRPGIIATLGKYLHGALDRNLHQRVPLVGPLPGFELPFLLGCESRSLGNLGLRRSYARLRKCLRCRYVFDPHRPLIGRVKHADGTSHQEQRCDRRQDHDAIVDRRPLRDVSDVLISGHRHAPLKRRHRRRALNSLRTTPVRCPGSTEWPAKSL